MGIIFDSVCSYGRVFLAINTKTKEDFVAKVSHNTLDSEALQHSSREINILKTITKSNASNVINYVYPFTLLGISVFIHEKAHGVGNS